MHRSRSLALGAILPLIASLLLFVPAGVAIGAAPAATSAPSSATTADQVVTVDAQPGAAQGQLHAWERRSDGSWAVVLGPVTVNLGSRGIGQASEGSSFTPAGTYPLTTAFGRQANPGTRMSYRQVDRMDWWNGNVSSAGYNTYVRQSVSPGGASENLYDAGPVYDLAVVIGYNINPVVPGAGSAFFVHVSDGSPTAGCVSLPRADMNRLITWLDPAKRPEIRITTGGAWTPTPAEGEFITVDGGPTVYRIAGGAPVFVSTWNAFGGVRPTRSITSAQFAALRQYPADGAFIGAGSVVYRMVGGAPVFVSTWNAFGGVQPTTFVDPQAIANAGAGGAWNHLRWYPADGTFIGAGSVVYRMAGGAPVFVSTWNAFGGVQPTTFVDPQAIANAGAGGAWNHLRWYPADDTFLGVNGNPTIWRVQNGRAVFLSSWDLVGGVRPTVTVDHAAIVNAGAGGAWNHLRP